MTVRGALAVLAALAVAPGCAPHRVAIPDLDTATRRARFEARLEAREARAAAAEAELVVWAEAQRTGPLPGFRAALALAGPDAFRLRVESLFGTALDLGARGDSVVAWVPPRRAAVRADARRDSIGLADPGGVGLRLWSAALRPPALAWSAPDTLDSLVVLRWRVDGDSVALAVAPSGLPRLARIARPGAGALEARWTEWAVVEGLAWPARLELEDGARTWRAACRIDRVRFHRGDGPARAAVRVPADAAPLAWSDLRRAIERGGVLP